MSFTAPNHTRSLFWGLSCTWLYIASVVWYCVMIRRPVDPLTLATGGFSVGLLIYGASIIHRALLVNLFPLGFSFYHSVWGVSGGLATTMQVAGSLVLALSCLVILWTLYHSHREEMTLEKGLPFAFLLALPLVVHELTRLLLGIDLFATIFAQLLGLL